MSGVISVMVTGGRSLAATASGAFFYGGRASSGTATTSSCTITASGGSGSYGYAWTRTSGDATCPVSNASAATVTWSHTFGPIGVLDSFWQCVVTDTVSSATVTITGIQAQLERTYDTPP